MKRTGLAFGILAVGFLCLSLPSFGALIMSRYTGYEDLASNVTQNGEDEVCVTFIDGNAQTKKYFPKGYELSLKDAPFSSKNTNDYTVVAYTWVDSSGRFINNHFTLNDDLTLTATSVSSGNKGNLLKDYYEEYGTSRPEKVNPSVNTNFLYNSPVNNPGTNVKENFLNAGLDNQFSLSSNLFWLESYNNVKGDNYTAVTSFYQKFDNADPNDASKTLKNNITGTYDSEDYPFARRGGSNTSSFLSGKYTLNNSTIGLETHPADYLGTPKYNKFYKPVDLEKAGLGSEVAAKDQSEYCTTRIILNCDVVYTGQMTLGGLTGFRVNTDDPPNWTQLEYQGFMIGAYAEIDLNGFDFVLEGSARTTVKREWTINTYDKTLTNGMVDAFGSITDSSEKRTGNLVLRSGAVLYTSLVFEDMYREETIPESYLDGASFMNMFRCPYLDCSLICEAGSKFYGKLYLSFGNNGISHTDIGIVGNSSDFLFQLKSGKIVRTTYYNTELFNLLAYGNTSGTGNLVSNYYTKNDIVDITYQRFRYVFDHAEVDVNPLKISISYDFAGTAVDIEASSAKFILNVPPYFDFYSFGSSISICQQIKFMVGCYLFGDEGTKITFKYGQFSIASNFPLKYGQSDKNNYAAGINLDTAYYPFKDGTDSKIGWFDVKKKGENASNDGFGTWVWNDRNEFWNYYSKIPARMDYFGKFEFSDGNPVPYSLGGIINFADNDSFLASINGVNIDLYSTAAMTGPSLADMFELDGWIMRIINILGIELNMSDRRTTSISGFYNAPLISNGEILTPVEGEGVYPGRSGSKLQNCYYDIQDRLIHIGNNQAYAFMFLNDGPSNNLNWANNEDYTNDPANNSLSGAWKLVTIATDSDVSGTYITCNGQSYISYHGAFLKYNPTTNTAALMKLVGRSGKTTANDDFTGTDGRDVYRIMKTDSNGNWNISSATTNMEGFTW